MSSNSKHRRRRPGGRRGDDGSTDEFSLFHILDVNRGDASHRPAEDEDDSSGSSSEAEEPEAAVESIAEVAPSQALPAAPMIKMPGAPPSIFDALFDSAEAAQRENQSPAIPIVAPPMPSTAQVKLNISMHL